MRNLLIAVTLLLTAGAFYSAYKFKSVEIENDVTARVTDALTAENATDIGIDVDGRHVTLSGIVHDEATEATYLQTADDTLGALGPIDGLTFQADNGFVKVVKSAEGISLRGTVPSEEARAALVANAQAATDGAVDDQLTIAGPTADWQDEAAYGVTQMSGLTQGTLVAAAGSFALSGMTDSDPTDVNAAFADRAGWETFVSSSMGEAGLSEQVAALTSEVADRDASLSEFNALITDQGDTISDLNGQVTSLTSELDSVKTKAAAAAALAASLNSNVEDGDGRVAALQGQVATLEGDLDNAGTLVKDLSNLVSERNGQIEDRDAQIADLTANVAARGTTIERLNGNLDTMDARIVELEELNQSTKGEDTARIEALTADVASRDATIGQNKTTIDALLSTVKDDNAKISGLQADVASRDATIGQNKTTIDALLGTLKDDNAKISGLQADVASRDDTIKLMEDALGETIDEGAAQSEALQSQIGDLNGTLSDTQGEVAVLSTQVKLRDSKLASSTSQIAALTAAVGTSKSNASSLQGQVSKLTGMVIERDGIIADLKARPAATTVVSASADQCAAQATAAMEGTNINFGSGTARIDGASVELLERLTGIALACVSDDLSVEVGGHTDAQGSDADNQRLSEARAKAIVAFMAERGVSASGLTAVGYGEDNPIADNATPAGRAQNRRITFDWQAR